MNKARENQFHVLNDPPRPGNSPAEEDLGSETPARATTEPVKAVKKTYRTRKALKEVLGGDYLSREWVTNNITYILYLALLAMIYIANTYSTEKKFKTIERTKVELKELRYEYITAKSALMFHGRQSEISKRAILQGLHEAKLPPYKILYPGEALQTENR